MTSPKPLEADIEKKCVDWAKSRGFMHVKLDKAKRRWPDQLFVGYGGVVWFVEFKRPGEVPRKNQERLHDKIRERGHMMSTIDSVEQFRSILEVIISLFPLGQTKPVADFE